MLKKRVCCYIGKLKFMNKIKMFVLALSISALCGATLSAAPGGGPRPEPGQEPRPGPAPMPHFRPRPLPVGGAWVAAGGIAYLTGTVIRVCAEPPVVVVAPPPPPVVIAQPQTTVIVQNTTTTVLSKESLRNDLITGVANSLQNIPYSVKVDNFYTANGNYGASITVVASVNGENYSITSGGLQPSYEGLKTYLTNEIVSAVAKLSAQSTQVTKIEEIK